ALDADHAARPKPYGSLGTCAHAQRVRTGAVALMLTMLTSCAVGPEFQVPSLPALKGFLPGARESVPGSTVVRGAEISARWWEVFRSRPLNRLIQDGIDNNQDLRAAEAAVRVAQANADALRGTLLPIISASFDASRQLVPVATLDSNATSG